MSQSCKVLCMLVLFSVDQGRVEYDRKKSACNPIGGLHDIDHDPVDRIC